MVLILKGFVGGKNCQAKREEAAKTEKIAR